MEKPFWQSKTFWIGVLEVAIGCVTFGFDSVATGLGVTAIIFGILMIIMRTITSQNITLK